METDSGPHSWQLAGTFNQPVDIFIINRRETRGSIEYFRAFFT
jgi:hypothetical protein